MLVKALLAAGMLGALGATNFQLILVVDLGANLDDATLDKFTKFEVPAHLKNALGAFQRVAEEVDRIERDDPPLNQAKLSKLLPPNCVSLFMTQEARRFALSLNRAPIDNWPSIFASIKKQKREQNNVEPDINRDAWTMDTQGIANFGSWLKSFFFSHAQEDR
eukprot:GEMP01048366.1.p1 GENE.GEMP01048366.1~~GEMP01048366.1.p1  ORF type:complete len:163 (+),score=29.84 GEMP01048366.1:96-584(+)